MYAVGGQELYSSRVQFTTLRTVMLDAVSSSAGVPRVFSFPGACRACCRTNKLSGQRVDGNTVWSIQVLMEQSSETNQGLPKTWWRK